MSLTMTVQEREAFLADVHVGIIAVTQEGRAPLAVPVWYSYVPGGELTLVTGNDSRKLNLIRQAGSFSLCVQTEQPPYRYVSVEGPVVAIEAVDTERDLRPLARRYLGTEGGDQFVTSMAGVDEVLVRMQPTRWLSVDYGKAEGGA